MRLNASDAFWRRTPPALFPSTLGVIGLSLGWRAAGGFGALIGDLLLIAGGGFFAFAFLAYAMKLAARPSALLVDLDPMEGRAAVSAGSMCLMMLAASLYAATGAAGPATALWLAGLALHFVYALVVATAFFARPAADRLVAPPLFLPAIGVIVAPIAGVPLGFGGASALLLAYAVPVGFLIGWLSLLSYVSGKTSFRLRPAAAIPLAPASVAGSCAALFGAEQLFTAFLVVSCGLAAGCVFGARWLAAGGPSPLWGAFTFPAAAFAGLIVAADGLWGGLWSGAAIAALAAATLIVLPIWAMTARDWASGRLAVATGATTA
ncbi:MAG: hypothetical protein AAF322_04075 [Pseudomonadota bacterium]